MPIKGEILPHSTVQTHITRTEYQSLLIHLSNNLRGLVMVRMLAETGMTRQELVNLRREDLDISLRRLYLSKSKSIKDKRQGGKWIYKERNRYIPINGSLLPLLSAYLDTHTSKFMFPTLYAYRKSIPMKPSTINELFVKWKIPWSPHKFRHFFRAQIRKWMIKERQVDMQVIKELMGHKLTVDEAYGGESDFEYKTEIVDAVFL